MDQPALPQAELGPIAEKFAGRTCPYCRFPLKAGGQGAFCAACHALHHADCWQDNGGCSVVGCPNAPAAAARQAGAPTAQQPTATYAGAPTAEPPDAGYPGAPTAEQRTYVKSPQTVGIAGPDGGLGASAEVPPPVPPARSPKRSDSMRWLSLAVGGLAAALVGLAVVLLLHHGSSRPVTVKTVAHTGTSTSTSQSGTNPQGSTSHTPTSPSGGTSPSAGVTVTRTTPCGGDLSIGPNTSCGFAQAVEVAYLARGGGDADVTAFSAAAGRSFTVHCTSPLPHVCTAGTTSNASIYFTSGPSTVATRCGGGLSVGPNTSCGFAQNVENAYVRSGGGDTDVTAFSPATARAYTIHCTSPSPHVCTGGTTKNASIYFG